MRVKGFLVLSSLLGVGFASPAHVVHEKRNLNNKRWVPISSLSPDAVLPMRVGLKQDNLEQGDLWLHDVSHPESPNFGKHWTAQQVKDAFKPSHETVKAVHDWLHAAGIHRDRHQLSEGLNWLEFDATVAEAESLLKTKYQLFEHESSSTRHVACDHYSLPSHVRQHVDFVSPGVHFDAKTVPETDTQFGADGSILERRSWKGPTKPHNPSPVPHHKKPRPWQPKQGNQICNDSFVDPACLRLLYDVPENVRANKKNSIGIVEYAPESYLGSDLDLFFKAYAPDQVGERPIFDAIDGGYLDLNFTLATAFDYLGEPSLDLQYSMALAYPQKVILYQAGDLVEGASFNNFLDAIDASYCTYDGGDDKNEDAIYPDPYPGPYSYKGPENCGTYAPAKVISTSYSYDEFSLPDAYAIRQCHEYMKLGLMGTTFVYSSGDFGVSGYSGYCLNANGTLNDGLSGKFVPTFPSTCPYVLSAGATQIQNNTFANVDEAIEHGEEVEEAMELTLTPQGLIGYDFPQNENPTDQIVFSSSGGFSNVFALPEYQAATVKRWWAEHDPKYSSAIYNNSRTTRAFPDISANGAWYSIVVDGELSEVFGTSCAAPVIAAILALINGERLNAGKSSIGFINPTLYAHPEVLHDITLGANPGCGTRGFSAVAGWDPVTGLGTPNYPKMLELFLSLP